MNSNPGPVRLNAPTLFVLASAALLQSPIVARATVIDFDSYAGGTPLNTQYSGLGATFSATTSASIEDIIAYGGGYNTSSPRNVATPAWGLTVQGTLRVDFSSPASAVSFFAIDVGDSSRDACAYDAFNNLLETITVHNPGTGAGIGNIDPVVFSVGNIAYITFGHGSVFAAGDGAAIDDLSFTIPAPGAGACALMFVGGLIARRRRGGY